MISRFEKYQPIEGKHFAGTVAFLKNDFKKIVREGCKHYLVAQAIRRRLS
jgi:hypothetical protein